MGDVGQLLTPTLTLTLFGGSTPLGDDGQLRCCDAGASDFFDVSNLLTLILTLTLTLTMIGRVGAQRRRDWNHSHQCRI